MLRPLLPLLLVLPLATTMRIPTRAPSIVPSLRASTVVLADQSESSTEQPRAQLALPPPRFAELLKFTVLAMAIVVSEFEDSSVWTAGTSA